MTQNPYLTSQVDYSQTAKSFNCMRVLVAVVILAFAFFASLGAYSLGYSSGYYDGNTDRMAPITTTLRK